LNELVVADAGPLIALGQIDSIELLARIYPTVLVPGAVEAECVARRDKPGIAQIETAFSRGWLTRSANALRPSEFVIGTLGEGESAAIELAERLSAILLIDERRGRVVASDRGLRIIGTLAVLITARRRGLIPALNPLLQSLLNGGYFISEALVQAALMSVGESAPP
jgi:uncharacterized protein